MTDAQRCSVDFIARLAEAWDGRGAHPLTPPSEHLALLNLAQLSETCVGTRWSDLLPMERRALLFAARRAIELGRACAWVFGEGRGA